MNSPCHRVPFLSIRWVSIRSSETLGPFVLRQMHEIGLPNAAVQWVGASWKLTSFSPLEGTGSLFVVAVLHLICTLWLWLTVCHGIDGPFKDGLPNLNMVDLSMANWQCHNLRVYIMYIPIHIPLDPHLSRWMILLMWYVPIVFRDF